MEIIKLQKRYFWIHREEGTVGNNHSIVSNYNLQSSFLCVIQVYPLGASFIEFWIIVYFCNSHNIFLTPPFTLIGFELTKALKWSVRNLRVARYEVKIASKPSFMKFDFEPFEFAYYGGLKSILLTRFERWVSHGVAWCCSIHLAIRLSQVFTIQCFSHRSWMDAITGGFSPPNFEGIKSTGYEALKVGDDPPQI